MKRSMRSNYLARIFVVIFVGLTAYSNLCYSVAQSGISKMHRKDFLNDLTYELKLTQDYSMASITVTEVIPRNVLITPVASVAIDEFGNRYEDPIEPNDALDMYFIFTVDNAIHGMQRKNYAARYYVDAYSDGYVIKPGDKLLATFLPYDASFEEKTAMEKIGGYSLSYHLARFQIINADGSIRTTFPIIENEKIYPNDVKEWYESTLTERYQDETLYVVRAKATTGVYSAGVIALPGLTEVKKNDLLVMIDRPIFQLAIPGLNTKKSCVTILCDGQEAYIEKSKLLSGKNGIVAAKLSKEAKLMIVEKSTYVYSRADLEGKKLATLRANTAAVVMNTSKSGKFYSVLLSNGKTGYVDCYNLIKK